MTYGEGGGGGGGGRGNFCRECIQDQKRHMLICALPVCICHNSGLISLENKLMIKDGQADMCLSCLNMA